MCSGCNINPEKGYFSEEKQRVDKERREALAAYLEDQKKERTGQDDDYDEENDSYGEGKDPE